MSSTECDDPYYPSHWKSGYRPFGANSIHVLIDDCPLKCGGYGSIWRAAGDTRRRVIKLVARGIWGAGGEKIAEELNGVRFICDHPHPHIVEIEHYEETQDGLVVLMEELDGMLADRFEAGKSCSDRHQIIQWLGEAALALDHLRENGGQHRDVKLQNLGLKDNRIRLIDFSLTKSVNTAEDRDSAGTPGYYPPEVTTKRSTLYEDQYCLAECYYRLRTGGPTIPQSDRGIRRYPGLDSRENDIIGIAMEWDPSRRFTTCKQFIDHLSDLVGSSAKDGWMDSMNFFGWVQQLTLKGAEFSDTVLGPSSDFIMSLGDATFLCAIPSPKSRLEVKFEASNDRPNIPRLTDEQDKRWQTHKGQIQNDLMKTNLPDYHKVSPTEIVRPFTENGLITIKYYEDRWSNARAFHFLLKEDVHLHNAIAKNVLAVEKPGSLGFPGIVCCHIVVRTADQGIPRVLLCQRQSETKGRPNHYHPGRWSLSVEEQVKPGESLYDCVKRGLKEELLGDMANKLSRDDTVSFPDIRLVGAIIEKSILNVSLIVLVDLPIAGREIPQYWQLATDKHEHRQLASLALDTESLKLLADSGTLDDRLRNSGLITPFFRDVFDDNDVWDLHPTSLARAAMCVFDNGGKDSGT